MATTEKYALGAVASLMTTELNSLANNALAASSSSYNNIQAGGGGDGYTLCDLELVATFGTAPTANTGVSVWFLARPDGTNFEDGSASITPARLPDAVIPVRAVTTAQRIVRRILLPWGVFSTLLKNDGTGQALAASANTLKVLPVTPQGV
jgi:hypothetical protein